MNVIPSTSVTSISRDYLRNGELIAEALGRPATVGLYLPAPVPDETYRDEFGFVFLPDGSVGPFYVSMGNILQTLWRRHPDPANCHLDTMTVLQEFAGSDLAGRALAVGTYNALSASLYRSSGFEPPDRKPNSGLSETAQRSLVGMVGYFCPLVDRLTAGGHKVLVLERSPERIPERDAVSVTTEPGDLRHCSMVVCTASTLINDSLEEILEATDGKSDLELIGPSGSGAPDPLLTRGVAGVGGILFADHSQLTRQLDLGESWGSAGRKYQLDRASYPGLRQLLRRLSIIRM